MAFKWEIPDVLHVLASNLMCVCVCTPVRVFMCVRYCDMRCSMPLITNDKENEVQVYASLSSFINSIRALRFVLFVVMSKMIGKN